MLAGGSSEASIYYVAFNLLMLAAVAIGFGYLFLISILVHDTSMITDNFFYFIAEWVVVSALPAIPMLFFVVTRTMTIETAKVWFWSLSIKFAVFHLLLQLSGYYRYMFAEA